MLVHVCNESGVAFSAEYCEEEQESCCNENNIDSECCKDQYLFALSPTFKELDPHSVPIPSSFLSLHSFEISHINYCNSLYHKYVLFDKPPPIISSIEAQSYLCTWVI